MEVDKLTAEAVRYMLFKSYKQPNVPVKREELAALITENYKQRNLPATVIAAAQVRMHTGFVKGELFMVCQVGIVVWSLRGYICM